MLDFFFTLFVSGIIDILLYCLLFEIAIKILDLHILLLINNMVMIAILYSNTKLVWSLTISDDLYSIEKIKKRKNSD